jgi:hypothetical protein
MKKWAIVLGLMVRTPSINPFSVDVSTHCFEIHGRIVPCDEPLSEFEKSLMGKAEGR